MGFGIRHAVDNKTSSLEIRAYLGVPSPWFSHLGEFNAYETDKLCRTVESNFDAVFNNFPGAAAKFLSGTPSFRTSIDKETETLYFTLTGYRAFKVERFDEFIEFFKSVIIEEVCRRSVFDLSFGNKRFMVED